MNKSDRELLELAAKAGGIDGNYVENFGSGDYYYQGNTDGIYYEYPSGGHTIWNPLLDGGDALRLVVKLGIKLEFVNGFAVAYSGSVCAKQHTERFGTDENAAVRRVIVRAASGVGREM
jgi:hypothetical protein